MDISPYKAYNESRASSDTLNYFKARRKLEPNAVKERLQRVNQELKRVWYIDEPENTVDYIQDL